MGLPASSNESTELQCNQLHQQVDHLPQFPPGIHVLVQGGEGGSRSFGIGDQSEKGSTSSKWLAISGITRQFLHLFRPHVCPFPCLPRSHVCLGPSSSRIPFCPASVSAQVPCLHKTHYQQRSSRSKAVHRPEWNPGCMSRRGGSRPRKSC